jgi:hypothetical protein
MRSRTLKAAASPGTVSTTRTPGRSRSMGELVAQANRWRDRLNPLRGLTISRVIRLLEDWDSGDMADVQWAWQKIERRYPVLRSLVSRRTAAIQRLDWDIKVMDPLPPGLSPSDAEVQRVYLRGVYDRITNLREAIKRLARAEFRGFAILQKHRDEASHITNLHWLPQWNWVRCGLESKYAWNPSAQHQSWETTRLADRIVSPDDLSAGVPGLPRTEFVIRECEAPINEVAMIAFSNTLLALKDWVCRAASSRCPPTSRPARRLSTSRPP